jgi:hypothetical protein
MRAPSGKHPPSADAFSTALASYEPLSPHHGAILKSWRHHSHKDERSELWRSLEQAAAGHGLPAPQPTDFIGVVLGCTMPAARLNDHSQDVLKRFERLKLEIIKVVEDADYALNLWRDLARFETPLREIDRSDYDMHAPTAGGRNAVDNSRDRKLFAQRMFRYLKDCCGEYLAKEVAGFINIIFPTTKATDERTVRAWLSEITPGRAV